MDDDPARPAPSGGAGADAPTTERVDVSALRAAHEALRAENDALRGALRTLADVSALVHGAEDPEATAYSVLTGVTAGVGLGFNRAMIFERAPGDASVLVGRAAVGPDTYDEADRVWRAIEAEAPDLETLFEAGLRARAATSALDARVRATRFELAGHPRSALSRALERVAVAEGDDDLDGLIDPTTALAAPLRGREGVRGVLLADNRFTGRAPEPLTRVVFGMVAEHAARALFAADRWASLAREARTDPLTGLDSRRVGLALLEHALTRALVDRGRVALLLLDLDHFKRVNDTHGHLAGDRVLAEAAQRVRSAAGRAARVFRYGGEELGVLLEGVDLPRACAAAEHIRAALAARPVLLPDGTEAQITASIGVATVPPAPADATLLVDLADRALFAAKRAGRNRVEPHHAPP